MSMLPWLFSDIPGEKRENYAESGRYGGGSRSAGVETIHQKQRARPRGTPRRVPFSALGAREKAAPEMSTRDSTHGGVGIVKKYSKKALTFMRRMLYNNRAPVWAQVR